MSGTLLEHVFFVSCPRLDATESSNLLSRLTGVSWNWGSYCWFAVVWVLVSVVSSFVLRDLVIATIRNTKNNQIDRTLKSLD